MRGENDTRSVPGSDQPTGKITDRKRTLPLTVPEEEEAREQLSELKD